MVPRVGSLHVTPRLNVRRFLDCLDGLDDPVGASRPNERTNSLGLLAAHLADARHLRARVMGSTFLRPTAG